MPKVVSSTLSLPRVGFASIPKSRAKRLDPEVPELDRQVLLSKKARESKAIQARSVSFSPALKKGVVVSLIAVNLCLVIAYLIGINSNAASGYQIKKIQGDLSTQNEQAKQLRMKIAEANSLMALQNDLIEQKFVQVDNANFFQGKQLTSR